MALRNRAKMTTATVGTGTLTLGAASTTFVSFADAGVANAETVTYCIEDGNDFELGRGTYTAAGTTLSRDTVLLSKIGASAGTTKLTLSGVATVFVTAAAEDIQPLDSDLTAIAALATTAYGRGLLTLANAAALAAEVDSSFLTPAEGNAAYQPLDSDLTALAGNGTNGLWARTGAGTGSARTLTGTAAQITVTNGDGVAGAPTLSLPADVLIPTVLTVPNTGLHLLDTNASHDLIIAPGSNITADRTLTVTTGDTNIILNLTDTGSDKLMFWDDSAGEWTALTLGTNLSITGTTIDAASGAGFPAPPQGRLTLTASTPVMIASVTGATTVRYTPHRGRHVPIYNGSAFTMTDTGGELTQATTDTTKSPAAVTTNSNYDVFVWNDSGTIRATRGPAWTSSTGRGTGAGTTELVMTNGILLNNVSITNGPAASRGTYVGTIRSNGTSTIDWIFGTLAANGGEAVLGVWNAYNRVLVSTFVQDSTNSWGYSTATWRSANNSVTMRVSFVQGLAEDAFTAKHLAFSSHNIGGAMTPRSCGIGYDATNALAAGCSPGFAHVGSITLGDIATTASPIEPMVSVFERAPDLGFHFCQAIEISDAVGTTTWYGDNSLPTRLQNGLYFTGMF